MWSVSSKNFADNVRFGSHVQIADMVQNFLSRSCWLCKKRLAVEGRDTVMAHRLRSTQLCVHIQKDAHELDAFAGVSLEEIQL